MNIKYTVVIDRCNVIKLYGGMRKRFKYIALFSLWLSTAIIFGHGIIPHHHHYGSEPEHRAQHIEGSEGCSTVLLHEHFTSTDQLPEYICHFNPELFPEHSSFFFCPPAKHSAQQVIIPFEPEKMYMHYDSGLHSIFSIISHPSRPPPSPVSV